MDRARHCPGDSPRRPLCEVLQASQRARDITGVRGEQMSGISALRRSRHWHETLLTHNGHRAGVQHRCGQLAIERVNVSVRRSNSPADAARR